MDCPGPSWTGSRGSSRIQQWSVIDRHAGQALHAPWRTPGITSFVWEQSHLLLPSHARSLMHSCLPEESLGDCSPQCVRGDRISEHGEGGSVSPQALLLPASSTHLCVHTQCECVHTEADSKSHSSFVCHAYLPGLVPYHSLTETLVVV